MTTNSEHVYIKHTDDSKIWEIPTSGAIHSSKIKEIISNNSGNDSYGMSYNSPIIVSDFNIKTLPFIVNYISFYSNKPLQHAPEKPIKNIHLSVIFGDEYHLFVNIHDANTSVKDKLLTLNEYIKSAIYFDIKYLVEKFCAIISVIIKELTPLEISSLMNE